MMKNWIFLLLIPLLMGSSTNSTRVKFFKGSLNSAKEQAAEQGKLYFVDFTASWCMPCRWMDETTFSDPALADYIHKNYIPVKVDIDDFDGYAYKQVYNIKMLPSILIFNSKGKLIAQYEESMAPSKMIKILQQHNTPENRVRQNTATAYATETTPATSPTTSEIKKEEPVVRPNASISRPKLQHTKPAPSKPAPKPSKEASPTKTNKTETNTSPLSTTNMAPGSGLYRFKVSRQASVGFSIQTGVYGQYGNVLREAAKLEADFQQPIIIHIAQLAGKPVYKVLLGEFENREAATAYQQKVKNKGIVGLVKDLSTVMP